MKLNKIQKLRIFFAFLFLSAYFYMLTPLYSWPYLKASTIQELVADTTDKKDCENFIKYIANFFQSL